jgi:uncharacterized OB-fold protein
MLQTVGSILAIGIVASLAAFAFLVRKQSSPMVFSCPQCGNLASPLTHVCPRCGRPLRDEWP